LRKAPSHGTGTGALGGGRCPNLGDQTGEVAISFRQQILSTQLDLDGLL
jgi:hypothetical protein